MLKGVNNFIKIYNSDYINSYLLLKNEFYLSIDFLKFFDIYLFTFSFYMANTTYYNDKFIIELNKKINNMNLSVDKENLFSNKNMIENKNLCIFSVLYKILHKYATYNNISLKNICDFEKMKAKTSKWK